MPKSKHRKITSRIGRAETMALHSKRVAARYKVYEMALPDKQEYPPLTLSSADRHPLIIRAMARAEEIRQRRNQKRTIQFLKTAFAIGKDYQPAPAIPFL